MTYIIESKGGLDQLLYKLPIIFLFDVIWAIDNMTVVDENDEVTILSKNDLLEKIKMEVT